MPKIVIPRRAPRPDSDFDEELPADNNGSDREIVDVDGENDAEADNDNEEFTTEDAPTPSAEPVKRARGRPRGRGRGASSSAVESGPPRPRGRPRGSGRGRGRPPRAGSSITIKLPKRAEDESDGDETEEADEVKEKPAPLGGGKPFRKIQGEVYIIDGDEFVTPDDPKGDEKIDQWGNLLGGRRLKANTFVLPNRHPSRLYMLAIDAARTSGFRDSLYYFRRNPLAFKLNATAAEKDYLINEGKLGSHLRTRSVTLITARSAFKLHGSKMVIDGRWVTDDYYEDKVTAEIAERGIQPGELVGELPDPNADRAAAADTSKGDRAALQAGASGLGVYRAGGPTTIFGGTGYGPFSDGPLNAVRKSLLARDGVTEENWMLMMAQRVSDSGAEWTKLRRAALKASGPSVTEEQQTQVEENEESGAKRRRIDALGAYEPHTGLVLYRSDTQPTRSRMEKVPDESRSIIGGSKAGNAAWGLAWVDTVMEFNVEPERAPHSVELIDLT
ncbi:hypothetical protein BDZ89DRAFT_1057024 [Hymenopellis radicata]|nr:hypothetical protein BDZ89DRAFT_1057024 [Hymenopellis radicata]